MPGRGKLTAGYVKYDNDTETMMLKRSILAGVFLFLASALMIACDNREPVGVPPAATPSAATTGTATATAVAAAIVSPSASPTATVELTATVTVTATLPPEVTVLDVVNIRSGPSTDYPIVGYIAAGSWLVIGRSANGLWWRIQCPERTASNECWITASEEAVAAGNATAAPVAAAPPLPTATLAPTAIPCVVSAGPGWATYQVVGGDTLSSIAARFGGSVGQIMAANCLTSDAIAAGSSLWVPASGGTVAMAGSVPPTSPQPTSQTPRVPDGIAPALPFENPNLGVCPEVSFTDTTALLTVVVAPQASTEAEILDTVCLYVRGFSAGAPPTVTVKDPEGRDVDFRLELIEPEEADGEWYGIISFVSHFAAGEFHAAAQLDPTQIPTPLVITAVPPSMPRLRTRATTVARGEPVIADLAGFSPLQPFFLYGARGNVDEPCERIEQEGHDSTGKTWCFIKPLRVVLSHQDSIRTFEVSTADLAPGDYMIHPGISLATTPEMANRFRVNAN